MQCQSAWVLVVFGRSRYVHAGRVVCSGVGRVPLVQQRPRINTQIIIGARCRNVIAVGYRRPGNCDDAVVAPPHCVPATRRQPANPRRRRLSRNRHHHRTMPRTLRPNHPARPLPKTPPHPRPRRTPHRQDQRLANPATTWPARSSHQPPVSRSSPDSGTSNPAVDYGSTLNPRTPARAPAGRPRPSSSSAPARR